MSLMRTETLAIKDIVQKQLTNNAILLEKFRDKIQQYAPHFIVTVARGSSDHAATFAKYLFETELGLVVSSAAPSIYSLYAAPMHLDDALVIALSQSGQSPDICEAVRYAHTKKALTLALVNATDSPLAELSEYILPLHAGPEHAVAATKSYMAMLTAMLHLTAILKEDNILLTALKDLPQQFSSLESPDFTAFFPIFAGAINALVIGRGFGFPIAEEIALKFKEVSQLHAEGFSGAEVLHGPFSLFNEAFPVVIFLQNDAALPSLQNLIAKIRTTPVQPLLLGDATALKGNEDLPHITLPKTHPLLSPILAAFVMYQFIEQWAVEQGLNPDDPPLIQKVTRTL